MSEKLVCSKCGNTTFYERGCSQHAVLIRNGAPGGTREYECSKCHNYMKVAYPAVYYGKEKAIEVEVELKSK